MHLQGKELLKSIQKRCRIQPGMLVRNDANEDERQRSVWRAMEAVFGERSELAKARRREAESAVVDSTLSVTPCAFCGRPSHFGCEVCDIATCSPHGRRCFERCDWLMCRPCWSTHSCVPQPPSPEEWRRGVLLGPFSSFGGSGLDHPC